MVLETLLGGVFGGLLRLAPEALKFFDKKNDRQHELQMLDRELEFAKTRAEATLREGAQQVQMREFDAIGLAFEEQSKTAQAAGKYIAAITALVRPITTYLFLLGYFIVKMALYALASETGQAWDTIAVSLWSKDDTAILFMIISFWFVGRVYERRGN
jgi:hypothetical protein